MILTLSWLKEHLKTKASFDQVSEKLTHIGLEVEGIKESHGELSEFKIAKIVKMCRKKNRKRQTKNYTQTNVKSTQKVTK